MYSNLLKAPLLRRVASYIIDLVVALLFNLVFQAILMVATGNKTVFTTYAAGGWVTAISCVISFLVFFFYFCFIPYFWGNQTIGRAVTKILVVSDDYEKHSLLINIFREFMFNVFFIVFIIVDIVNIFVKDSEMLQDTLTHTTVVMLEESRINQEQRVEKEIATQHLLAFINKFVSYIFLLIVAVIIIFPFYWMIVSSLKTKSEFFFGVNGQATFFPETKVMWTNYPDAMNSAHFGRYFFNTALVGVVSTILSIVVTILGAYAFSRMKFKGKETLFSILLATMMIPGEMFTTTNFITVSNLGWRNSYTVLMVPFLVSVFYIYLLRQNFMQIPEDLYLAAKIDGTSDMRYLLKVMIPLAKPSIITITILKMMGSWNAYIWPNLINESDSFQLITSGLRKAFTSSSGLGDIMPDTHLQMAACTVVSIPLFVIFLLFRKYIMRGVSRSGIKG